jgi:epoxyqueuosine reductase
MHARVKLDLRVKRLMSNSNLTKEVKEVALSSGAELVGITLAGSIDSIPRHWVGWDIKSFTKKTTDYMKEPKSIIVLGYQAWDDVSEIVISRGDSVEYPVYQRMRLYARRILRFLLEKGFEAVIHHELISQKRMAQLAGLGNFGKNSLIINPMYGPWFRLQSILTDAELVPDKPFTEDLCGDCRECIKACPVGALTPYKVDPDKCLIGISEHEASEICKGNLSIDSIRDIPNIVSIFEEHMPRLTKNSVLACMTCQKACPYGKEGRGLT